MHCIALAKERKKENVNSRVTLKSRLARQHFIAQLLIGHLPRKLNNGRGMLFSIEQAFVGRDEKRVPLKMPAWEAKPIQVRGIIVKYVERWLNINKKQKGVKGHPFRYND